MHALLLSPRQYVVQNRRSPPLQWLVQVGVVSVHVAQLHGSGCGGVSVGVGLGVGRGTGFAVGLDGVGEGFRDGVTVGGWRAGGGTTVATGACGNVGVGEGCCDTGCCAVRRPVTLGEGAGLARPPTVSTVAVVALSAPVPAHEPSRPSSVHSRVN